MRGVSALTFRLIHDSAIEPLQSRLFTSLFCIAWQLSRVDMRGDNSRRFLKSIKETLKITMISILIISKNDKEKTERFQEKRAALSPNVYICLFYVVYYIHIYVDACKQIITII